MPKPLPAELIANERLEERDAAMWAMYRDGALQSGIAKHYGVAQSTVSQALARVRATLPAEDVGAARMRDLEVLDVLQREALAIVAAEPAPLYSAGHPVLDKRGEPALDHSGRLAGIAAVVKLMERRAKVLGYDAPERHQVLVAVTEQAGQMATRAAQDALARLNAGEETEEDVRARDARQIERLELEG